MIQKKNLQVIGACVEMQKASLEDEMQLIDGIPFDIDFSQDFSKVFLNGQVIADMAISEIIASIVRSADTENIPVPYDMNNYDSGLTKWEFNEMLEDHEKESRKAELKWKKDKKKRKECHKKLWEEIEDGSFFLNNKQKKELKKKWRTQNA